MIMMHSEGPWWWKEMGDKMFLLDGQGNYTGIMLGKPDNYLGDERTRLWGNAALIQAAPTMFTFMDEVVKEAKNNPTAVSNPILFRAKQEIINVVSHIP